MGRNDEVPRSSAPASPASSARAFGLCIAAVMLLAVLAGCASLPTAVERTPTQAFSDTGGTQLGRSVSAAGAAHPGRTAVHALPAGRDAFAARHALARAAQRSIDVQYYIWHPDTSGGLLAHALWQAAERGVRVRMLLDDQNTKGMDPAIAALDAHPNIEVRLFNPFANRSWRLGDYAGDFARINRRMHNKSFTVDNQVSVVGGRNVGDEYLGAETAVAFADLDVIVAGSVVRDISASFDRYWNSPSAYPAASLLPRSRAMCARACSVNGSSCRTARKRSAIWRPCAASSSSRRFSQAPFRSSGSRRAWLSMIPPRCCIRPNAANSRCRPGCRRRWAGPSVSCCWYRPTSCPAPKAQRRWWRWPPGA
jgi:phosphatidylserine/phosphatidylglycerophosphate/cardiolipin synthase-like enzyme